MRLGIDFGTCFSSAALMKEGEVIPIKATDGRSYSWPSSAYLLPTGEILVGRAAENQRVRDITRYQHEFKRQLGAREPLRLGDRSLFAHELVAHMLRKLKQEAEHLVQEP